jgi:hypothetical protein
MLQVWIWGRLWREEPGQGRWEEVRGRMSTILEGYKKVERGRCVWLLATLQGDEGLGLEIG